MHVVILTYGSRGDVEPFVALADGLIRAGHTVRLCAPEKFYALISSSETQFTSLPGNPDDLVRGLVEEEGGSWWRMVRVMSSYVSPIAHEVFSLAHEASQGADVIVHSFLLTIAGHEIARDLHIPDISAQTFPVFRSTYEFPSVAFPDLRLGGLYRRLTHWVTTQTFWQGSRFIYCRVRSRYPDLPHLSGWPFSGAQKRKTPILYAFSPFVVPKPSDWDTDAHVTGYWFKEKSENPANKDEIEPFLKTGAPPVFVGFGSAVSKDASRLHQKVIRAMRKASARGVISYSHDDLGGLAGSERALVIGETPHQWLFPRKAAIVHHGGAGTTGAALRAGKPNIVVPHTADQPFWGRRVYTLGAGPPPIPAAKLSADKLARAIEVTLKDKTIQANASELGDQIRREDGVENAVELIERYVRAY